MKEKEKKQSKQHIQSLAELCIYEIYQNKFLLSQKERYKSQINLMKKILMNNSKLDNKNKSKNSITLNDDLKDYYNSFVTINFELKKEKQKILTKYNKHKEEILKEDSMNKQILSNTQYDNLILLCQIKEKDDILKSLEKSYNSLKASAYFKENKRETNVNNKWGEYYLTLNLNNLAEKMMGECQNFIQFRNKCEKKEKEKSKIKKKIELYEELIKYYKNCLGYSKTIIDKSLNIKKENENINFNKNQRNKKITNDKVFLTKTFIRPNENKLSLFDNDKNLLEENLIIDEEKKKNNNYNDDINNNDCNNDDSINGKEKLTSSVFITGNAYESLFMNKSAKNLNNVKNQKKKSSKSIKNFLTVDELFDINNHEGKEEAIIDDELHSDDETVFEIKVKPLKKVSIHYIPQIKNQVPKINLAQIEFNKQKVMNEADLYSLQRRNFKMQNIDENIKTMKKKIKKIRHICKINKKKVMAFENYSKNMENNYKALKPLKIQSSLGGVKIPKIQNFYQNGYKSGNLNDIDDIDLGEEDSDILEDDDIHDISNTETNAGTKISISDKNNIFIKNNYLENIIYKNNNNVKNKENGKKKNSHCNKASIRANSK